MISTQSCPIVGIGTSAGGLEALQVLLKAMPADSGAAFVVVQHLDPDHESMVANILGRATAMPVQQITDGMRVEPNQVYVIPPGKSLTLREHTLYLGEMVLQHSQRMPIDTFFWSLSEQLGESAIAIVLSGTGSDGTSGIRAIKGHGGMVLVQTPESAQFDAMPRNAIDTGLVDAVCTLEEIPAYLLEFLRHPLLGNGEVAGEDAGGRAETGIKVILSVLQARNGYDFSAYKRGTLQRRISRRMVLKNIDDLDAYVELLRQSPEEARELIQDLLINVTAFFRDTEAFDALADEALTEIVAAKKAGEPIRVWVPGCSTGEEAYSLAMLFTETMEKAGKQCPLQIFATDLDDNALAVARTGLYPENIAGQVSPARLQRFFDREDHCFRVKKSLRETVTFAVLNLLNDPPFSKLELVSCRNLLIYLNGVMQEKVMSVFHFALRERGILFLGRSETVGQQTQLFDVVDKKFRIYRRSMVVARSPLHFPSGILAPRALVGAEAVVPAKPAAQTRWGELVQQELLRDFAPATVLTNSRYQVLYFSGATHRYLEQPAGAPTQDLLSLSRRELRTKLRMAMGQAQKERQRVVFPDIRLKREDAAVNVTISAKPVVDPQQHIEQLLLVTFEEEPVEELPRTETEAVPTENEHLLVQQLEQELTATREHLQITIEEYESANEELQAANEEVMSVNEELQSTNEELESSKEELQSMNEELSTVNSQLRDMVEELTATNDDLDNLLNNTDIATLFLDRELRIKRFTPATQRLFSLIASDVGRVISDIRQKFTDGELLASTATVLDTLIPSETEIQAEDGGWFLRRILPYRTADNHIAGVVVTFIDITQRRRAEVQTQRLAAIVQNSNDAIILIDPDGTISAWNRGAKRIYGWEEEDALGMLFDQLLPETGREEMAQWLAVLAAGEEVAPLETQRLTQAGELLDVWVALTGLKDADGKVMAVSSIERDVTEKRRRDRALSQSEAKFRALAESAPDGLVIVNGDGVIEMSNSRAQQMFGYSAEALYQQPVELLIPAPARNQHREDLKLFFANPSAREMGRNLEVRALKRDGGELPVEVNLSPLVTVDGIWAIAAIRDVTQRKQEQADMREAKSEADQANATKTRFLAAASHDLRQPLQALKLLNGILRKRIDDPELHQLLDQEAKSISGMRKLLDSLLDISKLDAGAVRANCAHIPVAPIFDALRGDFAIEAQAKALELKFEVQEQVVYTDPELLREMLQNLLANAINYTERGEVILRCNTEGAQLRFTVADTGIGIPKEQQQRIFDEFHRLGSGSQPAPVGIGLGLSIVERLAKLMGTHIEVESTVGEGSAFSFLLPAGNAGAVETVETERSSSGSDIAGKTLLVVDDNADLLSAMKMLLSWEGFNVIAAKSPAAARTALEGADPALLVTDYRFADSDTNSPPLTGLDLIRSAREHLGRTLPAILLTGDLSVEPIEGLDQVVLLRKPMEVDALLKVIREMIQAGEREF